MLVSRPLCYRTYFIWSICWAVGWGWSLKMVNEITWTIKFCSVLVIRLYRLTKTLHLCFGVGSRSTHYSYMIYFMKIRSSGGQLYKMGKHMNCLIKCCLVNRIFQIVGFLRRKHNKKLPWWKYGNHKVPGKLSLLPPADLKVPNLNHSRSDPSFSIDCIKNPTPLYVFLEMHLVN